MGFFDTIHKKLSKMTEEAHKAQWEAEEWDAKTIYARLCRNTTLGEKTGYSRVLREKCETLSDSELKTLFDHAWSSGNIAAYNAIKPSMKKRGFIHEDENGHIVKNY